MNPLKTLLRTAAALLLIPLAALGAAAATATIRRCRRRPTGSRATSASTPARWCPS